MGNVAFVLVGCPTRPSRNRASGCARRPHGLRARAAGEGESSSTLDRPTCRRKVSHFDLPIALAVMAAIGAIPQDALSDFTVLGELGLDGGIAAGFGGAAGGCRGPMGSAMGDLPGCNRFGGGLGRR